jgi:hypothetical protein
MSGKAFYNRRATGKESKRSGMVAILMVKGTADAIQNPFFKRIAK